MSGWRVELDQAQLHQLMNSRSGPLAQALLTRGLRVETSARRKVKVDHGRLRGSITHELVNNGGTLAVRIGTNVTYAEWVHSGTGVYGPHHHVIVPAHASVLSFTYRGKRITVRSVKGQPANPFLLEALREFS